MGNLIVSKARQLFSYTDLQGDNMSASTSINIEENLEAIRNYRHKRKCIAASTFVFGLIVIIVIAASVNHKTKVSSFLKSLPEAFASASSSSEAEAITDSRRVSLTDTSRGRFYASSWNGTWISDVEFLYPDVNGGLYVFNVQAQNSSLIISSAKMNHFHPYQFLLSPDKKYLLIKRSHRRVFRRSSYGSYAILSLNDGVMTPLKPSNWSKARVNNGNDQDNEVSDDFLIRYVTWGPRDNALVYVDYDNNIFYRKSVMAQDDQITANGQAWVIYNGIPDWVFEEEVFEDNKALWWSPDGSILVWGSFDDSNVKTYLLEQYTYGKPYENSPQYPDLLEVKYPKVGSLNPKNSLWMTDLTTIQNKQILPPPSLANKGEVHFSDVTWADQGHKFAVTWFNRVQNESVVTLCDVKELDCSSNEILKREEPNGWIPYKYTITFNPKPPNPKTRDFVVILPAKHLKHHYRQLFYVAGDTKTPLTQVEGAEVTDILKWTPDGFIYYMSTLPDKPGTRHLFRVKAPPAARQTRESFAGPQCVTCNRTMTDLEKEREPCQYYSIDMSLDGSFMTMTCQGPDVPYACIHHTPSSHFIRTFETNDYLVNVLKSVDMPILRFIEVPVSESDQKAQVKLMLPPDFDSGNKYPLVVYAYGGPGFQSVNQKFDWNEIGTYLAGSANVIYAIVDPRGSGYQGEDWRFAVYKGFGTAEVQSLIEVTKHLQDNLGYIDKSMTAVWGWSYGGYLSLKTLENDQENIFACGASVAPVVDWRLYDTYYTERYMGLDSDGNEQNYNNASAIPFVENLRMKKYFLVHGTHDDNVHYQNSMILSAALEDADILFRQQAYPDQDHSISKYRTHLDHSLTNFFLSDCFGQA